MTIIVWVQSDHVKVVDMENKIHKAKKDKDDAKWSKNKTMDKVQKLKDHMRTDVEITDEEYLSIMSEVHEYGGITERMQWKRWKGVKTTLLEAHGSTLEVFESSGRSRS